MKETVEKIKKILLEAVRRKAYGGLLFSGGLDSSILAGLNPGVRAITVSLGSESEDVSYSVSLAKSLNMKHFHRKVNVDEAMENIPNVIRILNSFDPAIPNDLAVYFGLESAKSLGLDTVATGDGSDELFGGYSFMEEIDDLEKYIRKISQRMSFSSNDIGVFFGVKIVQPFIDSAFVDYALEVPIDIKIRKEHEKIFGKWILRKAFENLLPEEIVWQSKRPLEYGSGFNKLRQIISERVTDEEFKESHASIKFMSKEHFYYYKIHEKVVGAIPAPKINEKSCPGCGAGMARNRLHCRICGRSGDWRAL